MIKLSAETITEALQDAGVEYGDQDIRPAYSGRGMWGATCPAVDLPAGKLVAFMVSLALILAEDGRADDARELAEATCTDSMGLGIVAYWQNVELAD